MHARISNPAWAGEPAGRDGRRRSKCFARAIFLLFQSRRRHVIRGAAGHRLIDGPTVCVPHMHVYSINTSSTAQARTERPLFRAWSRRRARKNLWQAGVKSRVRHMTRQQLRQGRKQASREISRDAPGSRHLRRHTRTTTATPPADCKAFLSIKFRHHTSAHLHSGPV